MIRFIEKDRLDSYWQLVNQWIDKAIDHDELSIHDVRNNIENGKMGLLVASKNGEVLAGCIVEFIKYSKCSALRVVALGGERMNMWLDQLLDFLDRWAKDNDMFRIEQAGRKGWLKILTKYGYNQRYVVMTKDLSYG